MTDDDEHFHEQTTPHWLEDETIKAHVQHTQQELVRLRGHLLSIHAQLLTVLDELADATAFTDDDDH